MKQVDQDPNGPCPFEKCSHPFGRHINGSCYEVTEPEKLGVEIYCKCDVLHGQNLRLYQDIGVMFPGPTDHMITTKCLKCRNQCLLRIDETLCSVCRPYDVTPQDEIADHIIFRPVSQQELQRVI